MIYNRTQNDVQEALNIRASKVQRGEELTGEDILALERGLVTFNTLNRIETKQRELQEVFAVIGYHNCQIDSKEWGVGDWFTGDDLSRIIRNNVILKEAFFAFSTSPTTPTARYHYVEFNKIEKMLHDLEEMARYVEDNYIESGTIESGEAK